MDDLNFNGLAFIDLMLVETINHTDIHISDMKLNGNIKAIQSNAVKNNIFTPGFTANSVDSSNVSLIEKWETMQQLAQSESNHAKEKYEEFSVLLTQAEDKKNAAYIKKDKTSAEFTEKKGKLDSLMPGFKELSNKISNIESQLPYIESSLSELRKKKKTYDVLKYIPFVNMVSEIIKAITGDIQKLEQTKHNYELKLQERNFMKAEITQIAPEVTELEIRLKQCESEISALETQITVLVAERKKTAEMMVSWGDRKKYYDMMVSELRHLINMEADNEEIEAFIKANPPEFKLAA